MRKVLWSVVALVGMGSATAVAQDQNQRNVRQIEPRDLGVVEAPVAGSTQVALDQVPAVIKHVALVAFKGYDQRATLTGAQIDQDEVDAVYEIKGVTAGGRILEADVTPSGTIEELEIEIQADEVPGAVRAALRQFAPTFAPSTARPAIEKSIRPSKVGLPEIFYEFSGTNFDVEVRSDGRLIVIEPA